MTKTIVIPVTLDTKGEETKYLKEQIERKGHKTIVIDAGVLGKPHLKLRSREIRLPVPEVEALLNWSRQPRKAQIGQKPQM